MAQGCGTTAELFRRRHSLGVQLLQRVYLGFSTLKSGNTFAGGARGGERRDRRNAGRHSRATNCLLVEPRIDTMWRVDDQLNALALDKVNDIGTAFLHFV